MREMERRSREEDWLWLCSIPGLYREGKNALLRYFGSPEEIRNAPASAFEPWRKLGMSWAGRLADPHSRELPPEAAPAKLKEKGIYFIDCESAFYPERLRELPDYPYGLFFKGSLPPEDCFHVAIVGARSCSSYGRAVAEELAAALAARGDGIVSGMALGIDGFAQAAALAQGGNSYGVLGCGVDLCYPREHFALYLRLSEQGGVISEFPPGTQPLKMHFPIRNRLISGLADCVAVVEAREKSGSLITADLALDQGRDVYAVPGRCSDLLSRGCNRLIESGAQVLLSVEDFLEMTKEASARKHKDARRNTQILSGTAGNRKADPGPGKKEWTDPEKKVLQALDFTPEDPGSLCRKTGLNAQELYNVLLKLQLSGEVREISRQMYVKTKLPKE